MRKTLSLLIVMFFCFATSQSQTTQDLAFNVSVSYGNSPFSIVLKWKPIANATAINVSRKSINETAWTPYSTLGGTDSILTDSTALSGIGYEYKLQATGSLTKYAYIYTGKELPVVHNRGKVILLIDNAYIAALKPEINRLIEDMTGDGWQVIRHDISRDSSVVSVKSIIKSDYVADSININSLFILGHVPVPYSGNINPDGHPDHLGAWPADVYYADLKGIYTDISINDANASRPENRNIPGDGKFDQSIIPGTVMLQTGRVDLFDMPAFSANDTLLIQKYLNKDHAFRIKKINPRRRALIDDNFGYFGGEAFATSGWRNFYALVGSDSTFAGDYFTDMKTKSYIWSYGCGGGSYQSCGGVGSTSDFVADTVKSVFTMLFGSYFGDWDSQNNFLRAPLASNGWTLTDCWSGRPYWIFDHFGMGEPIGFSAKVSQNNTSTYVNDWGGMWIQNALMGDPTLRMHIISPPDSLKITTINEGSSAQLNWQASADSILGYYVYRADSLSGTFTLLTPNYIASTTFSDLYPSTGKKKYMVRATKLENAYTGSYYNLSQGIMDTITIAAPAISVTDLNKKNNQIFLYPNPAKEQITIENQSAGKTTESNISIYTLQSLLIEQQTMQHKAIIDISQLTTGMYIVKIESTEGIYVKKFIKD